MKHNRDFVQHVAENLPGKAGIPSKLVGKGQWLLAAQA